MLSAERTPVQGSMKSRTRERQGPTRSVVASALVCARLLSTFLLVLALLAPVLASSTRFSPQQTWAHGGGGVAEASVTPLKAGKDCARKRLPWQPGGCASWTVPFVLTGSCAVLPVPVATDAPVGPVLDAPPRAQFCGMLPDRPPRLAA